MFAGLHTLAVFAPLVGYECRIDTDLCEVSLHHFGHALCIRIVWALHRHPPQVGGQVFSTRSFQQFLGLVRVVFMIDCCVVI